MYRKAFFINAAMIIELNHALDAAEADDAVRVILLTCEDCLGSGV